MALWSKSEIKAWKPHTSEQRAAIAAFWCKLDEYYHGLGFTRSAAAERVKTRHPEIIEALPWSPAELLTWRPAPNTQHERIKSGAAKFDDGSPNLRHGAGVNQ